MERMDTGCMRILTDAESASVAGGAEDTSVYYDMGKAVGEAYAYARLKVGDFYEWVAGL